ncbi:hybrid sensor histidine kinase/response regulator [Desulfogranum mediterraneum]|uniref:hybrid sensor histidine kinase/response regulator n=1 Tax=Desulfogranum mediterraneum TaxID=160661 RepID=UPI00040FC68E|nr:ATP-binding protein [Desulfogranum mediterraneum]
MIVLLWLSLILALMVIGMISYFLLKIRPRLRQGAVEAFQDRDSEDRDSEERGSAAQPLADQATGEEGFGPLLSDWQYTFDAIIEPVLILDKELRVIKGNRAAHKLLSQGDTPLEGGHCYQLFAGEDSPCRYCPLPIVQEEQKPYTQEVRHPYLGKIFQVSSSPILSPAGVIGYIYSARDITHQRQLETQLVQAHKMDAVATLAGGIAHDFNNILGAILGNADLLLYRLPEKKHPEIPRPGPPLTTPEIIDHVSSIKHAGHRAKELVNQILAFSRQSASKQGVLEISPLIKESCKFLRASLPATIELKVSVGEGIGAISGDPAQIQQVLMNLCNNAAQALEEQSGTIEVSLREITAGVAEQKRYPELRPGPYVALGVRDTGRGISAEVLQRIFDPFFTTREVGDGTGMGLAVLHGIILAHNGVVDVKSEVGKGTVFTLFFPRIKKEEGLEEELVVSLPRGSETILYVDDEEEIVTMRTRMLEYLGYTILPATSPEQALEIIAGGEQAIDLLITDHTMPRMTGLQLAAEALTHDPSLPVILCSGYSDVVTPEEAKQAGVRRFLAKPLDMRLLATAIREILPKHKDSL